MFNVIFQGIEEGRQLWKIINAIDNSSTDNNIGDNELSRCTVLRVGKSDQHHCSKWLFYPAREIKPGEQMYTFSQFMFYKDMLDLKYHIESYLENG